MSYSKFKKMGLEFHHEQADPLVLYEKNQFEIR